MWQFVRTRKALGTTTAGNCFHVAFQSSECSSKLYRVFLCHSREKRGRFVLFLLENTFITSTARVSSVCFFFKSCYGRPAFSVCFKIRGFLQGFTSMPLPKLFLKLNQGETKDWQNTCTDKTITLAAEHWTENKHHYTYGSHQWRMASFWNFHEPNTDQLLKRWRWNRGSHNETTW